MIQAEGEPNFSSNMEKDPFTKRPVNRSKCDWLEHEQYVCGLCFRKIDAFSDPLLINCLHSICSTCASNIVQGSKCNLCQTVIDQKMMKANLFFHRTVLDQCNSSQNAESGHGDTNTNAIPLAPSSTTSYTVKCACCSDLSPASVFCNICSGPICDSCLKDHGLMKELKWHKIEKRNLAKERSLDILKCVISCRVHEVSRDHLSRIGSDTNLLSSIEITVQEIFDRFCESCQQTVCASCTIDTHSGHTITSVTDKSCSLNKETKAVFDEVLTTINDKTQVIESALDLFTSTTNSIDEFETRQMSMISVFQTKMKQFVDEVAKNATEKLRLNCEYRRSQLLKDQGELEMAKKKVSHLNSFVEDIVSQNFTVGLRKAQKYLTSRVDEQLKELPVNLTSPDPALQVIATPEYFDGKLIAENFFTFLRTHGETDELIRLFRRHIHERFLRRPNSTVTSPTKLPHLRPIDPVEIESPDKKLSLIDVDVKPPIPILPDSPIQSPHLMPDPRLIRDPRLMQQLFPVQIKESVKQELGPKKEVPTIPRSEPRVYQGNKVTCCVCLAQTKPQGGQVCRECSSFYHAACHTPMIETSCENWKCILCTNRRFSTAVNSVKFHRGTLNALTPICARILVSIIVKVNRSSVKSPFGTLSSLSDFNHIRNRLFPSRGCHVHYQTIFDFYRDVRSVLDGYRRFNESIDVEHRGIESMDQIDAFVHDLFQQEFADFHRKLSSHQNGKHNSHSSGDMSPHQRPKNDHHKRMRTE